MCDRSGSISTTVGGETGNEILKCCTWKALFEPIVQLYFYPFGNCKNYPTLIPSEVVPKNVGEVLRGFTYVSKVNISQVEEWADRVVVKKMFRERIVYVQ